MIQFAAHLEMNFGPEHSFSERWSAVAQSHLVGCEFVWRQHSLPEVLELQQTTPMRVTCLGGTTGFVPDAGRPLLIRPEDREWLIRDVREAIAYAKELDCSNLVFVPGNLNPEWTVERHRDEVVQSLKAIAPMLEDAGVSVVLEPLNSKVDHPGIYCDSSTEAFRIVEQVDSPNVKVLYDIYHMQVMEGNLIETIRKNHSLIGYYHVARVPGRYEPVAGEVNLPVVLEAIEQTGYQGFIGLEYRPTTDAQEIYTVLRQIYPALFHS